MKIKAEKINDKELMEAIDSINLISGEQLSETVSLVLKYGKVESEIKELEIIS